jgi:hypothetical protein
LPRPSGAKPRHHTTEISKTLEEIWYSQQVDHPRVDHPRKSGVSGKTPGRPESFSSGIAVTILCRRLFRRTGAIPDYSFFEIDVSGDRERQ